MIVIRVSKYVRPIIYYCCIIVSAIKEWLEEIL
jgi:hypothetical protein